MSVIDKRPRQWAAIFFLLFAVSACEKPQESLGIDLQPEESILGLTKVDTFTVRAYSLPEDSLRTEGEVTGQVGAYIDPIFGFTKASHYTEVRLSSSNPEFFTEGSSIENLEIDSLILNLAYNTLDAIPIYGSSGDQYFQVFEVVDSLDVDGEYYSNQTLETTGMDLVIPGENLKSINYRDSSFVDGIGYRPSLRIPLNLELGQRILDAAGSDGLSASEFLDVIKGLHITVDENAGGVNLSNTGILSFNSFIGVSRMEMYYRDPFINPAVLDSFPDTLFYDFEIRSSTGKFNSYEHDFIRGGDVQLVRQVVDSIRPDASDPLYLQGLGGVKMRIDLPYIESLREQEGLAVSKAELVFPIAIRQQSKFPFPLRVLVFGLDEEGESFLLDDLIDDLISFEVVDGALDLDKQRYRVLITRYIQQILSGEQDFHGLEVVVQSASSQGDRVVLNGPRIPGTANVDDDMRLEILFTNF